MESIIKSIANRFIQAVATVVVCLTISQNSLGANRCQNVFSQFETTTSNKQLKPDDLDFIRDWGTRLLKDDDPTFNDKDYLALLTQLGRPGAVGMDFRWRGLHDDIFDRWTNYWSISSIRSEHVDGPKVLRFTNSGTDANNALYEFAEHAFKVRTGLTAKRAHLLYFKNSYSGVHGRSAEISSRYEPDPNIQREFEIPSPQIKDFSKAELRRVRNIEDEALAYIRNQVARNELEIGGIFIEPIPAAKGVFFYSPSFLRRLRALADELRVPIFADEVLTGGGRTGKFWAFQHYRGFTPDMITFGKGLMVSGVAEIRRFTGDPNSIRYGEEAVWKWPKFYDNTSRANALTILQSSQVLKTIHERGQINEVNKIGPYFISKLKVRVKRNGGNSDNIRGAGLLIYGPWDDIGNSIPKNLKTYLGRMTPNLSLTREEVDAIMASP